MSDAEAQTFIRAAQARLDFQRSQAIELSSHLASRSLLRSGRNVFGWIDEAMISAGNRWR
jgi:hypothetical protein